MVCRLSYRSCFWPGVALNKHVLGAAPAAKAPPSTCTAPQAPPGVDYYFLLPPTSYYFSTTTKIPSSPHRCAFPLVCIDYSILPTLSTLLCSTLYLTSHHYHPLLLLETRVSWTHSTPNSIPIQTNHPYTIHTHCTVILHDNLAFPPASFKSLLSALCSLHPVHGSCIAACTARSFANFFFSQFHSVGFPLPHPPPLPPLHPRSFLLFYLASPHRNNRKTHPHPHHSHSFAE